jgi:ABC-type uncharacterized transport system involved in gliding motility auxiliary subunit
MRRDYAKFAGWAALVLLAATGITYAVRATADWGLWVPLGLGVAAAAWWGAVYHQQAVEVITSRRARQGGLSAAYVLAVVVVVVLVQALAVNNDASFDISKGKKFTLADETVKAVKGLDQKVQFYAFYGNEDHSALEDVLKRVKALNPAKVDYEFVNVNKKPLLAEEYGVRSYGTTVLVAGDKKETLTGSKEEDVLNAILKIGNGESKQVYFLAGHQERAVDDSQQTGASALKTGLEAASFSVRSLNLATADKGEVPADAAAVVVAGPRTDLLTPELDSLTRYLGNGGRVFVALDPRVTAPNLKGWLAKAGVQVDEDVVIDMNPINQLFGGSPIAPITNKFDTSNPVTKDLSEQHGQVMFPETRTIELGKLPEGANGTVLVRSLETAFGWTGSGNSAPSHAGPKDKKGPLDLAVAIEAPVKDFGGDAAAPAEKKARLVALGTSMLMGNQGVGVFNNQDLVVNSLRWLADEEKRIALAPKPTDNEPMMLDGGRMRLMWFTVLLLAFGALGAGVTVAVLRRRSA